MTKRGLFITLEGIEGAGKSTVIDFMQSYLRDCDINCIVTREFGGTEIAEKVRKVLLSHHQENMSQKTEVLLAFAGRAQHLENLIRPALREGIWVLCDRFTDSTYAYQGGGRKMSREDIAVIEQWVQEGFKPDHTFLLDVDVMTGLDRVKGRSSRLDRIESETIQFFERVRKAYLDLAADEPKRFKVIDGAKSLDGVLEQVEKALGSVIAGFNS